MFLSFLFSHSDYRKDDEKESQKKVKPEDLPKLEKELDMLKVYDEIVDRS